MNCVIQNVDLASSRSVSDNLTRPQSLIRRALNGGNVTIRIQDGRRCNGGRQHRGARKERKLSRPFHEAYLTNKVVCQMAECLEHFHSFKESGLDHHFENLCICREIDRFAETQYFTVPNKTP